MFIFGRIATYCIVERHFETAQKSRDPTVAGVTVLLCYSSSSSIFSAAVLPELFKKWLYMSVVVLVRACPAWRATATNSSIIKDDISLKSGEGYGRIDKKGVNRMRDKRIEKVKQHFDIFINGQKFKVLSIKIDEVNSTVSIKTKIFGQAFPHEGRFVISVPSQELTRALTLAFRFGTKDGSVERWEYSIVP